MTVSTKRKISENLHHQVCGSDGKTYENSCELENVSCRKYWDIKVVSMVSEVDDDDNDDDDDDDYNDDHHLYNLGINLSTGSLSVNMPWS